MLRRRGGLGCGSRRRRDGLRFDAMVRDVELEEMDKKWKADNERIMREHPAPSEPAAAPSGDSDWGKPAADPVAPQSGPRAPAALPGGSAPPIPPAGLTPPSGDQP